jgi:hypothetical protein
VLGFVPSRDSRQVHIPVSSDGFEKSSRPPKPARLPRTRVVGLIDWSELDGEHSVLFRFVGRVAERRLEFERGGMVM